MRWVLGAIVLVVVAVVGAVRFAPSNISRWHVAEAPRDPGDYKGDKRFTAVRTITAPAQDALTAVTQLIAQTPRTSVFAGSAAEGMVTFQTRSRLMGYPDFTSVSIIPAGAAPGGNATPLLMIAGRSRFGRYDFGVNEARITGWLAQLAPEVMAS